MKHRIEIPVGSDRLIVESGHLAKQANGSCTVRFGDTVVLTTACMATSAMPRDFLPLTVDYREYTYAAGRIPGGFFKREGRPTEKETITSRLIDRPLRPLFPPGYTSETQIISLVLSADGENDPDVLAINGASFALVLSNIPFYHPIGAVRVGLVDGEVIFNPTNSQRDVSDLDLVVVGTEEAVVMVEAGANQLSEETILDCIWKGHQELQKIIKAQIELFRARGLEKPSWTTPEPYPQEYYQELKAALWGPLKGALDTKEKFARKRAVAADGLPHVEPRYLREVNVRHAENQAYIDRFVLALAYRYQSYGYALDHLLVETQHVEAVKTDAALSELAIWVDRAEAHDFCGDGWGHNADGDGAIRSRVLMNAPSEGEYLK
ncbi:MAG TPA: hypothetical protein PKM64_07155 [Thermoanaerobaculia bacterium]|nr:hypothetical protein [Thermoanaerobaculia bacterium]